MEPKQKQYPAVDVAGDRSKVRSCKEQYCIGTWNVRSMNQGKLEVVKQEMARVNDHMAHQALIRWLITHVSRDCSCTDHVNNHEVITWLSCTDHVDNMH